MRSSIWCWDARPFPAFPDDETAWADARNWQSGQWISGRIEPDETVTATISNPSQGGPVTNAVATGTITNDDFAPVTNPPTANPDIAIMMQRRPGSANG